MKRLLPVLMGFVLLSVSSIINADGAITKKIEPLQGLALELIDGLDRSRGKLKNCRKMGTTLPFSDKLCRKGKKTRIALRPFLKEKIPVAPEVADAFNDELLAQLIRQADGRYEFVSRSELSALTTELFEFGEPNNPINNLLKKAADIDVLILGKLRLKISGKLRPKNSKAILSYKALGMDGNILVSTAPREIPLSRQDAKITQSTVTVSQAVNHAAKELADKAENMTTLVLGSIVFETSGAQPPFGRYVKERLSTALQNAFTKPLTGTKLKVIRRGDEKPGDRQHSYLLHGSYWDLSESVELRVSLKNQDNEVVSSEVWIRSDTIKQRLRPEGDFSFLRDNDSLGPFNFHLTSARGTNPVYHVGDKLKLVISLDSDAWVYCFNFSTDNKLYQLFPNPHYWKKHKEPHFAGGVPITMPDKNYELYPYDFKVVEPPGNELVKCFAASRNVTSELPQYLQGRTNEALPKNIARNLSSIFQQLPDVAISEASFIMTIPE